MTNKIEDKAIDHSKLNIYQRMSKITNEISRVSKNLQIQVIKNKHI